MSSSHTASPLLAVESLYVDFVGSNKLPVAAVKDVSFQVAAQQTVALVGESGSGKSVTATSILRLLPRTARVAASRIEFMGRNILQLPDAELRALRGKDISMVFQDPMSSLNPVFTVGAQLVESLQLHMGMSRTQSRTRAVELLHEVGIPKPELRIRSYPHELSGGQQQRVMIALAIACQPRLLIADEPTTALDVTVQKQVLELLLRLREQHGMAMLFITHDLGLVREVADQVVVMQQGEIREQNNTAALFANPQHPYTRALMACRPRLDVRPQRLPVIDDFMNQRSDSISPLQRQRGTSSSDSIVLEVKNLQKRFTLKTGLFKREQLIAVQDVSFQLPRGKTVGIVGESGSGKTTTALSLLRLTQASGGQVLFEGKDLLQLSDADMHAYRRCIQIVFQNPFASLNPRFTVAQLLLEPMQIHHVGTNIDERLQLAAAMLQRVGLPEASLNRYPHEFSGGQRQRIAIARCLTLKPEVLILDESVSALDVSVQAQVLNLLQDLQDEFGLSYIFISHDLSVVKYMSDRVLVMQNGQVVEMADSDQIYATPQAEYTRKLLNAIPGQVA